MKKIVSVLQPFTYTQKLFVYDDDKVIDIIYTSFDKMNEDIFETSTKYETNLINLIGGAKFSKGIKEKIEEAEMLKYNKNNLKIVLIKN